MDIKRAAQLIEETLVNGIILVSVKEKIEYNVKILEVVLDGNIDSSNLEETHLEIASKIDSLLDDDAYLEVTTPGLESPINSIEQLQNNTNKYIYFESDVYCGNADLLEVNLTNQTISVSVNLKGRYKKMEVQYSMIKNLRNAVKF
ncbi:MAG: hypothetical protein LBV51_03275 [Acholeplasmatales bacterium]|nr:hypothetical protein [Acholeplasmatales bacterium]